MHVPSGEPAGSLSRPPAKRKTRTARPIKEGKLLRAGGPSKSSASRPTPAARPLPGKSLTVAVTPPAVKTNSITPPSALHKAPPPPPAPTNPMYRAKYTFEGQSGEVSLLKDDVVELIDKVDQDWWLVKKGSEQGWAPHKYLEPVPAQQSTPPPPPPRVNRPVPVNADTSAKPISVSLGLAPPNGNAPSWTKAQGASGDLPASSRLSSALAGGAKAPPLALKPSAPKPKPAPKPPISGAKPTVSSVPLSTPILPSRPGGGMATSAKAPGQLDLAAAVSIQFTL